MAYGSAAAIGVATLGTLFVSLAPAARLGALHTIDLILALQALAARRRRRRQPRPAISHR